MPSKRGHLTKTGGGGGGGGCPILHKSNTFSDENVKTMKNLQSSLTEVS